LATDSTDGRDGTPRATEQFLALAGPALQDRFSKLLAEAGPGGWATLQQTLLDLVDEYLAAELRKPVEANIDKHEAGGQWRIAFPHLMVRRDPRVAERLRDVMLARKAYTDAHFLNGFPDCVEVHHEIETFLYFQLPLLYSGMPGSRVALESVVAVARHLGNWQPGAPAWYDWDQHGFVSTWLGSREVRAHPPHDYQEANHFRFTDLAVGAYLGTGERRYLDLVCDYADCWCDHIETLATAGQPIRCSILPEHVDAGEMGFGGKRRDGGEDYKVFYATVAANTAYDIAAALMDLCRVTGQQRYLAAARAVVDQFFDNGREGRPAVRFSEGSWALELAPKDELGEFLSGTQASCMLARLALRHDMITGENAYRQAILDWAATVNEEGRRGDQMAPDVLVAAHFYDGDARWLSRAYAMAIRTTAVVEADDGYHQCSSRSRQGSKFLLPLLYQPLLGGMDWGARGSVPVLRFRHRAGGEEGLPKGVAFRSWRIDSLTDGFEAVNLSDAEQRWTVEAAGLERQLDHIAVEAGDVLPRCEINLRPRACVRGRLVWSETVGLPAPAVSTR